MIIQAPVAERPVALPPAIMRSVTRDNRRRGRWSREQQISGLTSRAAPAATRLSPVVNRGKDQAMRIYIFKSETRKDFPPFPRHLTRTQPPPSPPPLTP